MSHHRRINLSDDLALAEIQRHLLALPFYLRRRVEKPTPATATATTAHRSSDSNREDRTRVGQRKTSALCFPADLVVGPVQRILKGRGRHRNIRLGQVHRTR